MRSAGKVGEGASLMIIMLSKVPHPPGDGIAYIYDQRSPKLPRLRVGLWVGHRATGAAAWLPPPGETPVD
jgi:hypothetical protein